MADCESQMKRPMWAKEDSCFFEVQGESRAHTNVKGCDRHQRRTLKRDVDS